MSNVVRFPPLPPVAMPSGVAPDDRQQTFRSIIDHIVDGVIDQGHVDTISTATGFRASSVDLGALQDRIEDGLACIDMAQIRERCEIDVRAWLIEMLRVSVQRCKSMHFDLAENGVHIKIQTQDDRGYYDYEFDVFPGQVERVGGARRRADTI